LVKRAGDYYKQVGEKGIKAEYSTAYIEKQTKRTGE